MSSETKPLLKDLVIAAFQQGVLSRKNENDVRPELWRPFIVNNLIYFFEHVGEEKIMIKPFLKILDRIAETRPVYFEQRFNIRIILEKELEAINSDAEAEKVLLAALSRGIISYSPKELGTTSINSKEPFTVNHLTYRFSKDFNAVHSNDIQLLRMVPQVIRTINTRMVRSVEEIHAAKNRVDTTKLLAHAIEQGFLKIEMGKVHAYDPRGIVHNNTKFYIVASPKTMVNADLMLLIITPTGPQDVWVKMDDYLDALGLER